MCFKCLVNENGQIRTNLDISLCIYTNNWAGSVENEFLECSRALRLKSAIIWTFLCCFVMPICFVLFCLFNRVQGACLQQKWTLCIGFYGWSLPGSKLLFSAQPGRTNIIYIYIYIFFFLGAKICINMLFLGFLSFRCWFFGSVLLLFISCVL